MTGYAKTYKRSGHWRVIGIALGVLAAATAAEWFVTYCAFSSNCPAAEQIADWPLGEEMAIVSAR
jgi:hypothetical protein